VLDNCRPSINESVRMDDVTTGRIDWNRIYTAQYDRLPAMADDLVRRQRRHRR
jgi:hypothetical protein